MWNLMEFEYVFRLLISALCGAAIGYERKNRAKEAGVRTHCVVACASALMMILSKYAYADVMTMYGEFVKVDPSRIASGVVSGIGFLGAGMIFVHDKTVTGLTTAAGIWATSGVGMAIGAGMYVLGISSGLILLLIQMILHIRTGKLRSSAEEKTFAEDVETILRALEEKGYQIQKKENTADCENKNDDCVSTQKTRTVTLTFNE